MHIRDGLVVKITGYGCVHLPSNEGIYSLYTTCSALSLLVVTHQSTEYLFP